VVSIVKCSRKISFIAYNGLVPMSPKTTPILPAIKAAVFVFLCL
jgi:hypothetical protein